jgi:tRNA(fMet)-specific endonuclease VapC
MNESYLLDTDIIIYWLKNTFPRINEKIEKLEARCLFISSITIAELFFGAYNSSKPKNNLKLINELNSEINVINFDTKSGNQFGKIKADLKTKGKILNDSDLFIAATAISNDLILVTNNEKHFQRIGNLKVQNWVNN